MTRLLLPDGREVDDPIERFIEAVELGDAATAAEYADEVTAVAEALRRPFDPHLHPRNRLGQWREVFGHLFQEPPGRPRRGAASPGSEEPPPELVALADRLSAQWTEALRSRKKGGEIVKAKLKPGQPRYGHWQPPEEGWHDEHTLGDGVAGYRRVIEYAPGKRATVFVRGKFVKPGEWKVRVQAILWDQFSPETVALADRIAAIPTHTESGDVRDWNAEEHDIDQLLGDDWIRLGGEVIAKRGNEAILFDSSRLHDTVFAYPVAVNERTLNRRLEELLNAADYKALVGEATREQLEEVARYGISGWKLRPLDDNTAELTFRRESREDKGDVELKLLRVSFDEQGRIAGFGEAASAEQRIDEEKQRFRREAEERNDRVTAITTKVKQALAGEREQPLDGGEDWDETREALLRLNFRLVKRSNTGKGGWRGGYREVWGRKATGSQITVYVTPNEQRKVPHRFMHVGFFDYGRPAPGVAMDIRGDKTKFSRGERESPRGRFGRMPQSEEEWKQEILGRADELAAHYGEETNAVLVTFSRENDPDAPPDMNAYIDGDGVMCFGVGVLPALLAYAERQTTVNPDQLSLLGEQPLDPVVADAWSAWATVQHEVNHSVNRASGWWGGYSDHDGTKNFEESLTEELARLLVGDWMESADEPELAEWARSHAANRRVQGAYQLYRTNFKRLLDELEVPEEERRDLLERWKFNLGWQERMKDAAERLAEEHGISVEEARTRLRAALAENGTINGHTRGAMQVQEFRPILKVGPLPPVRSDAEIAVLRAQVEPQQVAYRESMAEFERLRDEYKQARYRLPGAEVDVLRERAREALATMQAAREAYLEALDQRDLAPLYEEGG